MKVSCTACGKRYDPLKKDGICPYCGMHAAGRKPSVSRKKGPENSGGSKQKLSPLRRKKIQIPLCLLLTAAIIGVFVWGDHYYEDRLEYYLTQRSTSQMHTEQHRAGDSVVLTRGSDGSSSNVRVLGCRVRDDLQSKISGEFKIIELDYEDTGTPRQVRLSDAFLLTADGCTVLCLDKFDIMSLTGMNEKEYSESEYCEGIFSAAGRGTNRHKVLFAAPKDETEHTVLMFRQSSDGTDGTSPEMRYDFILGEEDAL